MLLRVIDACHTIETDGYDQETPVVHLFGRTPQGRRRHVRVDDFRPYFCVPASTARRHASQLASEDAVLGVEPADRQGRDEQTLADEPLTRIVCRTPGDVRRLRDSFDDHYEADIPFTVRFLIDADITQWVDVDCPRRGSDQPVSVDDVTALDDDHADVPDEWVPPRVCVFDIEVEQTDDGPPVISEEGVELATQPLTAITAYDTYSGQYFTWLRPHHSWMASDTQAVRDRLNDLDQSTDVTFVQDSGMLAVRFVEHVMQYNYDVLTAWNVGFDVPYLVNHLHRENLPQVHHLSPVSDVREMSGDGSWINSDLDGRIVVDLLSTWEKSKIHVPDSRRLEDVAEQELDGVGKLDVEDIDDEWKNRPASFAEYSLRDVIAAVQINEQSNDNVRLI